MTAADLIWMALILGGAGWLLHRSLFKRKGHCHGCESGSCERKQLHAGPSPRGLNNPHNG